MKFLVVLLILLATPAMAQQREYTLKLPADMLNQVGVALDELPGHVRKPIADVIVKQINEQNAAFAKEDAAKAEAAKPKPNE